MGNIAFNIEKIVNLNKTVNLDINKNVDVNINIDDLLATAEADAEAFGEFALAEVDAYTFANFNPEAGTGEAFAYAESTAALDLEFPERIVWGVQPETGLILKIDPMTGNVLDSFSAPGDLQPDDVQIGLSIAEAGNTLIYTNSDDPNSFPDPFTGTIYRLDPDNGGILSTETTEGFALDGLGFYNDGTDDLIFHGHNATDVHRQVGYGGFPETFFWEDGGAAPIGGLGGDDTIRQFGFYTDGFIHEYSPIINDGSFDSTIPAPAADIEGMAFDGDQLYVSTGSGDLYTLDPDTGDVLNVVPVVGGGLYGLAALSV